MGIYCYTFRAQTKIVGNLVIGRFAFAYKESFWRETGAFRRRVAVAHAHAEASRYKLPNVELAIMGDFTDAATEKLAVFKIEKGVSSFLDSRLPGDVVGHLSKVGRDYVFEAVPALAEAA